MGLFGLFKKKSDETKVGNVEDFLKIWIDILWIY